MDLADLEEVRKIAEYRRGRKTLRATGTGSLAFGALALLVGIPALADSFFNIILVLMGLLLLVEGIWNVCYPSAVGIIVDGFALLAVGAWNIFLCVMIIAEGPGGPMRQGHDVREAGQWFVLAVIQIAYAIYRFSSYPRFAKAFRTRPDDDELARLDELVGTIQKSKPKETEGLISFQADSFPQRQVWKGQLTDNAALFVAALSHDVLVAGKDEVDIQICGKVLFGKTLKAKFRIRDHSLKGFISPDSLATFNAWKAQATATREGASSGESPEA